MKIVDLAVRNQERGKESPFSPLTGKHLSVYDLPVFDSETLQFLSQIMFLGGFASILGSIGMWYTKRGDGSEIEQNAHAERWGIFVGLWAPCFFTIAIYLLVLSGMD
jgi:hypothetical protein